MVALQQTARALHQTLLYERSYTSTRTKLVRCAQCLVVEVRRLWYDWPFGPSGERTRLWRGRWRDKARRR
jgi:hypothetical protein